MTFQRPYQRSSEPSNAPANCHANAPANECQRYFQRLFSNPPYPPALETPNAAGCAARRSRRFGREGRKVADHRHECSNALTGAARPRSARHYPLSPTREGRARNPLRSGGRGIRRLARIAASFEASPSLPTPRPTIRTGFSRALSHEPNNSWKPTRARGRWSARFAAKSGSRGVGGKSRALPEFHVPVLFRGPVGKFRRRSFANTVEHRLT
ncbi:hypothetical protein SAMN05216338_104970 [Bradyrhizobium sp. Rc2d]|nr:hypothetical protein SAMN05216338_104970 [Bradyrhizobium sp. Rc2d]